MVAQRRQAEGATPHGDARLLIVSPLHSRPGRYGKKRLEEKLATARRVNARGPVGLRPSTGRVSVSPESLATPGR